MSLTWRAARYQASWGLFVPHAASFAPKPGSDPSYEPVRHELYRYRIAS